MWLSKLLVVYLAVFSMIPSSFGYVADQDGIKTATKTYAVEEKISSNGRKKKTPHPVDFDLVTAQAGITTDNNVKDRIIVSANMYGVRYNGLYEGFQTGDSFLDDLYFRNEILIPGIGSDHLTPVSVIKLKEEDDKLTLDTKVGISNTSILKKLLGNGKLYLTTDMEEVTGFFSYGINLSKDIKVEITSESTFGPGRKPFMYIEGELQKRLKPGLYAFVRGEIDNQKHENKVIFGLGYRP